MSDIKVTQTEIDLLLNGADVQVRTEFGKCTVVTVRLAGSAQRLERQGHFHQAAGAG